MDIMEETKTCTKCRETKSLSEFPKRGGQGPKKDLPQSRCRTCRNKDALERNRVWREADPERWRTRVYAWREKNPERAKAIQQKADQARDPEWRTTYFRQQRYNLSQEEYDSRIESQQGNCAICDEPLVKNVVDHDHDCCPGKGSCGKCVRSILCPNCNTGLGMFKDNPDLLLAAAMYVLRWKERHKAMT